jgi:hypothetical protein
MKNLRELLKNVKVNSEDTPMVNMGVPDERELTKEELEERRRLLIEAGFIKA